MDINSTSNYDSDEENRVADYTLPRSRIPFELRLRLVELARRYQEKRELKIRIKKLKLKEKRYKQELHRLQRRKALLEALLEVIEKKKKKA